MTENNTTFGSQPQETGPEEKSSPVDPQEEKTRLLLDSHAALARQGLERVAQLRPTITREEVEKNHKLITDAHQKAARLLGSKRTYPEDT